MDGYTHLREFLLALVLAEPRIVAMFVAVPLFNRSIVPDMLKMGVAAVLGLAVAPTLMPVVAAGMPDGATLLMVVVKEVFVGFVLGCLVAVPFWAFEAIGFYVDNQRGASIAATLNPLTGNDSSPLGILFNQAFIVFFFVSGGFLLMVELLYDSFRLWNVFTWVPTLRAESVPVLIHEVMKLMQVGLLLSAPVIIAMFLAELGLAIVSLAVPQLQVFFLAMPIKSALAFLVLMVYIATLFEYAKVDLESLRKIVPLLGEHWRPAEGTR